MSKLGVKYDGCQEVIDSLTRISNCTYLDLAEDLREVLSSLNSLKNKPSTGNISSAISNAEENAGKLREFTAGLQSYAEKLYEFDNTFYNNFVLLDGTNYDKYQSNISSISISDAQIKDLLKEEDKKSVEALVAVIMRGIKRDIASEGSIIKSAIDELKKMGLSEDNNKSLSLILRGTSFEIKKSKITEDLYIQLKKANIDINDVKKCAKYLHDEIGMINDSQLDGILNGKTTTSIKKLEKFVERIMSEDGARIYNNSTGKWSKYTNTILKSDYKDLNDCIIRHKKGFFKNLTDGMKTAAKDDLLGDAEFISDVYKNAKSGIKEIKKGIKLDDIVKDVKNIDAKAAAHTGLDTLGKAVGVIDKVITIKDNIDDNLKDESGNWQKLNVDNVTEFTIDTAVDLGASASAAAIGAAAGSVVPVAGTIVGAVAGAAAGIAMNYKFGDPPESLVDKTKNAVNGLADKVQDGIGGMCKNLGKVFW